MDIDFFFRGVFFAFLDMEGSFESQCNFEFLSEKPSHYQTYYIYIGTGTCPLKYYNNNVL